MTSLLLLLGIILLCTHKQGLLQEITTSGWLVLFLVPLVWHQGLPHHIPVCLPLLSFPYLLPLLLLHLLLHPQLHTLLLFLLLLLRLLS
jgi:hypothetical protein